MFGHPLLFISRTQVNGKRHLNLQLLLTMSLWNGCQLLINLKLQTILVKKVNKRLVIILTFNDLIISCIQYSLFIPKQRIFTIIEKKVHLIHENIIYILCILQVNSIVSRKNCLLFIAVRIRIFQYQPLSSR